MSPNDRASDVIDPNDPVFQYLTGSPPPGSSIGRSDIKKALAQLEEAARLATVPDATGKRWVPGLSIVVVVRENDTCRFLSDGTSRNRELAEAQEQQAATSEILQVISRSQTDVQPVLDAIVRSAVRLCDGMSSGLFRFDGELVHQVAQHNFTPEGVEVARRVYPAPLRRLLCSARAILDRAISHIPDVDNDPAYDPSHARPSAPEACWGCRCSGKEIRWGPSPLVGPPQDRSP